LGARVTIAVTLMTLIAYGVATGQLGHSTPWDGKPMPLAPQEELPPDDPP